MTNNTINNMPIGNTFDINNGVIATKTSKDVVTLDNGSTYRFEPSEDNVKFIKLT